MAKSARIIPVTNTANMEKLSQYRKKLTRIGRVFLHWPSLLLLLFLLFLYLFIYFFFALNWLNWLNFHVLSCVTL